MLLHKCSQEFRCEKYAQNSSINTSLVGNCCTRHSWFGYFSTAQFIVCFMEVLPLLLQRLRPLLAPPGPARPLVSGAVGHISSVLYRVLYLVPCDRGAGPGPGRCGDHKSNVLGLEIYAGRVQRLRATAFRYFVLTSHQCAATKSSSSSGGSRPTLRAKGGGGKGKVYIYSEMG